MTIQGLNFVFRQRSGLSTGQIAQGKGSFGAPFQVGDEVPPAGQHPPDLVIFAFADCYEAFSVAQRFQLGAEADRAVLQDKTGGKGGHVVRRGVSLVAGKIDLGDLFFRGNEPVEQVAVIGEKQQALGVLVQPSHGPQAGAEGRGQVVHDRGAGVLRGGDAPGGLVEHPDLPGGSADGFPVQGQGVFGRVNMPGTVFFHKSIDLYPSGLQKCFYGGAGTGSGVGEGFVQSFHGTSAAPSLSANEGRVAYLKERGWEVAATPVESGQVRLPKEADPVYDRYLALQKSQGFDLASYAGKTVMRYVYQVTNYPGGGTEPVYATLLIYKNQVIGGDVTDTSAKGQVRPLEKPTTPSTSRTTLPTETTTAPSE